MRDADRALRSWGGKASSERGLDERDRCECRAGRKRKSERVSFPFFVEVGGHGSDEIEERVKCMYLILPDRLDADEFEELGRIRFSWNEANSDESEVVGLVEEEGFGEGRDN